MGVLFRWTRVRWVDGEAYVGEGVFLGAVTDEWTSFSGTTHTDEYYLVQFDAWPGVVSAVKPGQVTMAGVKQRGDA
jgi:hypothetical protein